MKIFSTFLKVYLSAFFILFIAVGMTNGKTVINSIVPSMRVFDIVEINIKQIKVADGKKDNFLIKSIRPIYRKQDNDKLEEWQNYLNKMLPRQNQKRFQGSILWARQYQFLGA